MIQGGKKDKFLQEVNRLKKFLEILEALSEWGNYSLLLINYSLG